MYEFPHSGRLRELAKSPFDLSQLDAGRIEKMHAQAIGFQLLYGTERVDEEVMQELFALADKAKVLEKMRSMQSGEILNYIVGCESENRQVLHTAMRDQFGEPLAKHATELAARELRKLEEFLKESEGRFTDLIQIGIGGSDLGPRALSVALEAYRLPKRNVHFISNVDPDDANGVLAGLDLQKTLVVVVSKSGNTLETLTNEAFVREKMSALGIDPKKHFVAVTGEGSPMDNPDRYLASFYIWDFIGGRYSATSMVGAVTLAWLVGFEQFRELLRGAHQMDRHAMEERNLPLISALLGIWNRNFLHHQTVAIIPYSQALLRFPAHLQQLDMESNGKRIDKSGKEVPFQTGPVIWGEPGTNGQHSFYQLIHQGTDVIPLEFIGFQKNQRGSDLNIQGTDSQQKLLSNLFAQSIALAIGQKNQNPNKVFIGNRPSRILLGDQLTPFSLGALLSYYEHKVAFQGFIWNINSFDQEGVQLGKVLAGKMLALFKKEKVDFPLGAAYLSFLDSQ